VVAALDDVDVVADPRPARRGQRLAQGVVVARLQVLQEGLVLADRHDRVQVRKTVVQRVALLPNDAAGDGDRALRRLPPPQLVQLGVDLVLAGLPDDAGVEDGDVGALQVRRLLVAGRQQLARQALGVGQVHLAADRPDVECPHGVSLGHQDSQDGRPRALPG
jgi:hypothetical protein